MPEDRHPLPQLEGTPLLTDGGLETTLIFHQGLNLPGFAAFDLLRRPSGRETLAAYFRSYVAIARAAGAGFLFETPTWRANPAWGPSLGYTPAELADANRQAVALVREIRREEEPNAAGPLVISGCIGPRGDGYMADAALTAEEARNYHDWQIGLLARERVDLVTALTISATPEAIGIAQAARAHDIPLALSFTVETDGRLPSGERFFEAIQAVDAATEASPAYYMINCAHPTHFADLLTAGGPWVDRICGLRANASKQSHAELDASEQLDDGDPADFGEQYRQLLLRFPHFTVLGGCCGTDERHVRAIARAALPVLWEHLAHAPVRLP